jgi:putative nucleotidyltransferase with HDIG domain
MDMNLTPISNLVAGMQLSLPVYNRHGNLLLGSEIILSDSMIQFLKKNGIKKIYTSDIFKNRSEIYNQIRTILSSFITNESYLKNVIYPSSWNTYKTIFHFLLDELEQNKKFRNVLVDIAANDSYVFTHSLNVMIYSVAIAHKLNLKEKLIKHLSIGAILHDIGKIFISKEILNKNGRLTDEEFKQVQNHTLYGVQYLKRNGIFSQSVLLSVLQHHERLDGSGYPSKLKETDIHLFAKIIAVADVFDAISTDRCYRKALTPHQTIQILMQDYGNKFDARILDSFLKAIIFYPTGLHVKLSTGAEGKIIEYRTDSIDQPIVQTRDSIFDLQEHTDVSIVYAEPLLQFSFDENNKQETA